MSVKLSDDPLRPHDPPARQAENIHWLPRSRLRSGARGDRLMTGLTMLTAAVLAAAAGVAAWSRHGDLINLQMFASDKAAVRAPVAAPPPAPVARVVTPAAPSVDRQQVETPAPVAREAVAPEQPPAFAPAARQTPTIRTTSEGQLIDDAAPQQLASAPEPETPPPQPGPQKAVFEPVPPIPLSSAPPEPPPAPARSSSAREMETIAPAPPSPPPAPERAVAASNPAPPRAVTPAAAGAKVAVYLDEYPDQKAAAAGLSQKSGAYGKFIGSAGKLTYTRRNGNSWRLRVSNLDQATAEALCAKLKGAGAPCSVGPN